jgi:hypothetical protein
MSAQGRNRSLSALIGDVAFLADLPPPSTTTDITKAACTDQINAGLAELFNLCIAASDTIYRKTTTIPLTVGTSLYALPADYYQLKSLALILNTTDRVLLSQFTEAERPYLASATPGWNGEPFKYQVVGKTTTDQTVPANIEFLPVPASGLTIEMRYIYFPPRLVADNDTWDGFAGFEDYAVQFAAHRIAVRLENLERAAAAAQERERIKLNVLESLKDRDAFMPPRIQLTRETWRPRYARRRW